MKRIFCDCCSKEMLTEEEQDTDRDDFGGKMPQLEVNVAGVGYRKYEHACRSCRSRILSILSIDRPSEWERD